MKAYQDITNDGNSTEWHTGKTCIDCDKPAGTKWSPHWCFSCNVKRIDRITKQLESMVEEV